MEAFDRMSGILVLWKYQNYIRDIKKNPDYSYFSKQKRLIELTSKGDNVWLVTYLDKRLFLVARFVVLKRYPHKEDAQYGPYGIIGSSETSQYFEISISDDISDVIRSLDFIPEKKIDESTHPLPKHLQTIRELTDRDESLLLKFSERLKERKIC